MTNAEASNTDNDATVAQTGATVATQECTSKKAASRKKGAPKGQKTAKGGKHGKESTTRKVRGAKAAKGTERVGARPGSKSARVLDLLKRSSGATMKELVKATGWQPHSVRGFVSGTLGKKMGLAVTSTKSQDGERSYAVKN